MLLILLHLQQDEIIVSVDLQRTQRVTIDPSLCLLAKPELFTTTKTGIKGEYRRRTDASNGDPEVDRPIFNSTDFVPFLIVASLALLFR